MRLRFAVLCVVWLSFRLFCVQCKYEVEHRDHASEQALYTEIHDQ